MPRTRPATSGYARIAQAEEEEEDHYTSDEDPFTTPHPLSTPHGPQYAPIQPSRHPARMHAHSVSGTSPSLQQQQPRSKRTSAQQQQQTRRLRSNSGVDIKAINARLERWADEIASKFKIRSRKAGGAQGEEQLEIYSSVFQAPEGVRPVTAQTVEREYREAEEGRMSKGEFEEIVESVRTAIELGVHPKLISQGSSGSYFARDAKGRVVGVFKPKDEEPYASRNPKWTKWIHRNLFPWFFGRAMLIPNLSYVSEAAAYVLDTQLRTSLVPYTDVVSFSSKSFYYDFWDRRAFYRKKKPLPEKIGSLQVFLKGFKDASVFLKQHPWPDQHNSGFRTDGTKKPKKKRTWTEECRPRQVPSEDEEEGFSGEGPSAVQSMSERREFWTPQLQQSFREQLERLVILDYIMRNTDRGLDNWMIRINEQTQEATIVVEPPKANGSAEGENGHANGSSSNDAEPYKRREQMQANGGSSTHVNGKRGQSVSIGAIDNSLSWPWKHPDAWRSYPYGWLFLPVSLIGQPFSENTRRHFLPLLTSKYWWSETQLALRRCFTQDADFQEKMFARQMAVMKGQAWNVVETLKTPDHGPLELTRRARVYVWDDLVDIPVAVPLRVPSAEMRRRQEIERTKPIDEEEMDISAAHASAPQPNHDLLGLNSPMTEHPPNRFNMSRHASTNDARPSQEESRGPLSPSAAQTISWDPSQKRPAPFSARSRPQYNRSQTRVSLDLARKQRESGERKRRFSFTVRRGSGASLGIGDDDLEDGDLGYAAAEDMEGNQRKVIVERLENVKSKNPVFTWC